MHFTAIHFQPGLSALTPDSGDSIQRALSDLRFNLHPRLNLIAGPNAAGKTTILKLIARAPELTRIEHENEYWTPDDETHLNIGIEPSPDWPKTAPGKKLPNHASFVHIPAIRTVPAEPPQPTSRLEATLSPRELLRAAQDAANNILDGALIEKARQNLVRQLAPANLQSITQTQEERLINLINAFEKAYDCAYEICQDLLHELQTQPPNSGISGGYLTTDTYVTFPEMDDAITVFQHLCHVSGGAAGLLLWLQTLALQPALDHRLKNGWEERPVILTLDEPENHLHPGWQRRLLPALTAHFPNAQIFAATQSPYILQGAPADCLIHRLERNSDGEITVSTMDPGETAGWSIDRIEAELMNIRQPEHQQASRLRREAARETELDHEGERQAKISSLYREANTAMLLAGMEEFTPEDEPRQN